MRMSRLPLAVICPASTVEDGPLLGGSNAAADLGSAVHWWMAERIKGFRPDVAEAAAKFDCDSEELGKLAFFCWQAWEKFAGFFPNAETEVELWLDDIPGHADVLSAHDGLAHVADFKSGRLDVDGTAQLKGYCLGALRRDASLESAYGVIIRPRDGVCYGQIWSRDDLESWWAETKERLKATDLYSPGPHCAFCQRSANCPAKTGLIKQAMHAFGETVHDGAIAGDNLGFMLDRLKVYDQFSEKARELIKAEVVRAGGRLALSDGRELVITEQQQKKITFMEAWEALCESVPPERMNECVTVVKTHVEKAVSDGAGRGQKGKAIAAFMGRLNDAGAISIKSVSKLECKNVRERISE